MPSTKTAAALPHTIQITPEEARELHVSHRDNVPIWTLYGPGTSDLPGQYVARPYLGRSCEARREALLAPSLDDLRAMLPPGLYCLSRREGDDANIIESWL